MNRFGTRRALLGGRKQVIAAYMSFLMEKYGGIIWDYQDASGAVAVAENTALALGRNVALLTYADYVGGAGWSNPSAQLAAHAGGGGTATLAQAGVLALGKTYQIVTIVSGRTAGSVILTGTGAVAISANGTATDNITALGTALTYTPTNDFDGTINVATVTVQQVNIAASSAFPGAEELTNGDFAADTDWTKGDAAITIASSKATWSGAQAGNADLTATVAPLLSGIRYVIVYTLSGVSAGTVTPLFGTQVGTSQSASGTFTEEVTANGTAFLLRGNAAFTGSCEIVSVKPANPLNADHTGVTVAQPTGTPLGLAGSYDGATDYTDAFSAEINSMLDPTQGTLVHFGLSDTWAAGVDQLITLRADANNEITQSRSGTNLITSYLAAGVNEQVVVPSGSPAGFFNLALTWKVPGNAITYYNGELAGTEAIAGTWVGNLAAANTVFGAFSTIPTNVWAGDMTRIMLLFDEATRAELAQLYRLAGI